MMAEANTEYGYGDEDLPAEEKKTAKVSFFGRAIAAGKKLWNLAFSPDDGFDEDEEDKTQTSQNIAFYRNEIRSYPSGDKIENILLYWKGNYELLGNRNTYIQWLFPNRDPGINKCASVLTDEDVEVITRSPLLKGRVRRAFEMMLDLYGMTLTSDNQFQLGENAGERLEKINTPRNHNFACISRILLALKELGHKELMLPWLEFLADLVYREKVLDCAASSFENFWIDTLDAIDKIKLEEYLEPIRTMETYE